MEHAIPEQDEVEVLEVVVRHHSDQAVEEVRDVAEEEVEGIVEEAGLEDLAGREVVELVEEVDGEGEVEHIGVDEADMEEELIEQDLDLAEEAEVDQVMVEAQDDDAEGAQDDHAELDGAQVAEVDSSAEPPLSNTIDLTDSPQPSRRSLDPLQCPVCLDLLRGLPDWKEVVSTPCGHLFCNTCLTAALRRVWHCPACRKKTKPGDAIKIFL